MDKYVSQIKRFTPHLIAIAIFLIISAIYVSPSLSCKVMDVHDLETWQGMSKEVVDHRSEKSEEALWTKRMFSGMPAYQISTKSQNNLIQYVDKFFQLGLPRPMDMIFLYLIG